MHFTLLGLMAGTASVLEGRVGALSRNFCGMVGAIGTLAGRISALAGWVSAQAGTIGALAGAIRAVLGLV